MSEKKFKIVGLEDCKPCEELAEVLKNSDEELEFVSLNTEEGLELVKRGEIPINPEDDVNVPFAVNPAGEICEIFMEPGLVIAQCGDDIKVLYEKHEEQETDEK